MCLMCVHVLVHARASERECSLSKSVSSTLLNDKIMETSLRSQVSLALSSSL